MSLTLDARQRAMLAEMGIAVWTPEVSQDAIVDAPEKIAGSRDPVRAEVTLDAKKAQRAVESPRTDVDALAWEALAGAVAGCRACRLCEGRRHTVFGEGDPQPDWLVVGDAPGDGEDLAGTPFAGQEGVLLDNMLRAVGLDRRKGVFITQVLKCRPPANRPADPQELARCEPFLRRQMQLLRPKVILAMGRLAVQALLQTGEPIGKLRGRVHQYEGTPVVVTYPPAALLRNPAEKARAWADLVLAQQVVEDALPRH